MAESLGASSGIGYRLRQAADLVQTDQVFALTLTLVTLMICLESFVLKPLAATNKIDRNALRQCAEAAMRAG